MSSANPLQLLRSNTAHKRPDPTGLVDGRPAINTNVASPGLFFKDSAGNLVKIGPVHVGPTAPNASPASGGAAGNSVGEQWLDTAGGTYVFKVWDGSAWRSETGTFVDVNGDVMTGALVMDNQQQVRFREVTANGTNYIALQAPASVASDKTITLPDVNGTVVTTGDTGTVTSTMIADATIVDADISASAEIAVSKLADGTARQLLQTDAAGTGVEWTSNVDVPGTLDVTGAATFDSTVAVTGALTKSGSNVVTVGDTGTVTSTMILDGTIVNADVNASAAIAGTKISPDFGSQNITTTGTNTAASFIPTSSTVPTNGVYLPAANSVAISTGGSGRLFVDASGRIGLGTAVDAGAIATVGGALLVKQSTDTNGYLTIQGSSSYLTTSNNLIVSTNSAERLRITSAGLVGVGTSSPSRLLHVSGTTDVPIQFQTSQPNLYIQLQNSSASNGYIGFEGTTLSLWNNGSSRLNIDSSGRVGIGTTSPRYNLSIGSTAITSTASPDTIDLGGTFSNTAGSNLKLRLYWDGTIAQGFGISAFQMDYVAASNAAHVFYRGASEAVRIDASSRLLVGTSSARAVATQPWGTQLEGTDYANSGLAITMNRNDFDSTYLAFGKSRGTAAGSVAAVQAGDNLGGILFAGADGSSLNSQAAIIRCQVDGTPAANAVPGRLVFSTTADGASSPTERMRIDNAGSLIYGTSTSPGADIASGTGFYYQISTGLFYVRSNGNPVAAFNRGSNDGTLVEFKQDQVIEGTISVSGTTVSYNGAHLSRWSQLPSGAERTEILRGSVLSNIDEMCEWGEEANEQLNRMKVSDVEGDKNVSGVFQAWDDDDDTYTNDFYCAMTGDFIIRIAPGVTVERGDLLMSAGDGTAKPQDDDIIRSKTIAKVTSINVSCTYDDGSYCVPCVLMAC